MTSAATTQPPSLSIGADGFRLPLEAQTQTFAILAKRGVGKTYCGMVLAEEMLSAGLAVVAIDPVGVWWGLRSAADGKGPGLPVVIFGGEHGDVTISADSGEIVADVVIDDRLSCVIDLSLLRKGEQKRFVRAFAERLYHRNRDALHVIIDEADAFSPQRVNAGDEPLLGAIEDLVRRGRARGLGLTLITQRAAVLNKNVLTQIEVLVAMRVTSPQDRAALGAWVEEHGDRQRAQNMLGSLSSLPIGTAWWWSPGWLDVFERVRIRKRHTFDSSATPIAGHRTAAPQQFAEVDLDALRNRMASAVERAAENDPKARRTNVASMRRTTDDRGREAPERIVERIEVPVLSDRLAAELRTAVAELARVVERGTALAAEILLATNRSKTLANEITSALARTTVHTTNAAPGASSASDTHARVSRAWDTRRANSAARAAQAKRAWDTRRAKAGVTASSIEAVVVPETPTLKDGMRRILVALRRVGHPLTRAELATLADVTRKATLGDYVRGLVAFGYVIEASGGVELTQNGAAIVADAAGAPPQTVEILELHRSALKAGQYRILTLLVDLYPKAAKRSVLGAQADITRKATLGDYMRGLKTRGLIVETAHGAQAAPILFVGTEL